mmetsp:Transcript_37490/g.62086  ORF Transcript_37490/g.62086 Transcript_37490/m.62086 type:complete len:569 (+) Transcript_37490:370-2076(+)
MTAHIVLELTTRGIPNAWVLHEWWPSGMLEDELKKRNDKNTNAQVVAEALAKCPRVVTVCDAQRKLYNPTNPCVNFVGVPMPSPSSTEGSAEPSTARPITLLTLGIVCPRKNQLWAVEVFKEFAGSRKDVRLLIVGARYIREYEIQYVDKVKAAAAGDPRIEVHDVTNNVDKFYSISDALLFTSVNEVTPMVIAESMMRSIPVVTTDIAGIPEMLEHKQHGYVLPLEKANFVAALDELCEAGAEGQRRRLQMGAAAKRYANARFTNAQMVAGYRASVLQLSPPVILLDMDGVIVDWDSGFIGAWGSRSPIDRSKSYSMEDCVPTTMCSEAKAVFHQKGFFAGLPPREGAINAVKRMVGLGYQVFFCTAPVLTSAYCAGEKYEWIIRQFGQAFASRVIMTTDKTTVRGDLLIDDKPCITGSQMPTWQQVLFDTPYNRLVTGKCRLLSWANWEEVVASALVHSVGGTQAATEALPNETIVTKQMVAQLPDFSHMLPPEYRTNYVSWRTGKAQGAKGEAYQAAEELRAKQDAALNNESEDFTELTIYRSGYANWRRGGVSGAKSITFMRDD